ncbi:hypothetical protein RHMOL_Rhmol02G0271700 [Rhododendron molle]|uniref:Uncharacterized protein n=1 Tax=Rhododendron molle TaxID=49168 RepID=A0ACC0PWF0_RHOML|nr:hypothetical protein RHMOL_Rhmol02G0271700 [Rhododendron molle]
MQQSLAATGVSGKDKKNRTVSFSSRENFEVVRIPLIRLKPKDARIRRAASKNMQKATVIGMGTIETEANPNLVGVNVAPNEVSVIFYSFLFLYEDIYSTL